MGGFALSTSTGESFRSIEARVRAKLSEKFAESPTVGMRLPPECVIVIHPISNMSLPLIRAPLTFTYTTNKKIELESSLTNLSVSEIFETLVLGNVASRYLSAKQIKNRTLALNVNVGVRDAQGCTSMVSYFPSSVCGACHS